jgi:hypothetical protein
MQKTKLLLLSFFMIVCFGVSAEDKPPQTEGAGANYVLPENSPVQFVSMGDYGTSMHIKGSFVLTGTYHYGYMAEDSGGSLDLYLTPDKKSAGLLPYWQDRGAPEQIRFDNPEKFVSSVIPAADLKKLKAKSSLSLSGKASVLVKDYEASIDCDTPNYSVTFVSVQEIPKRLASRSLLSDEGC